MIILTGGAGFIGSCFLWKLNQEGIKDVIIVDQLGEDEKWRNLVGKNFSDYVEKNDFLELVEKEKIQKADYIIHMGACSSTTLTDAEYFMKNNFEYTRTLAGWAVSRKIPFLYASSAATYGDGTNGYSDSNEATYKLKPLNMYGYSKHLVDLWVLDNKLDKKVTGIKFFNVFGPNEYHKGDMQSVICKNFKEVSEKGRMKLFKSYKPDYADGEQKRDFIYIKDAIEVMYYFYKNPQVRGIYNLGTGTARSWNDLARAMFSAAGRRPCIEYMEMPESLREKYQYFTEADMAKLRAAGCAHRFMTLEDAVRDYAGYLKTGAYL